MSFFKGMVGRAYFGNDRKGDFRPEDLPDTRLKLFWEVFKIRWSRMIQVSLQMAVFYLPLFVWMVLTLSASSIALEGITDRIEQVQVFDSYIMLFMLVSIPLLLISSLGQAGGTHVLQRWALDDQAFAWSDFWLGIRQNWKQALGIGLFNGVAMYMGYLAIRFYQTMSAENPIMAIPAYLVISMLALLAMMNIFFYPLMVSYQLKLRHVIRNAFLLSIARLPWTLLFLVITLIPAVVAIWYAQFLVLVLFFYAIFGLALMGLIHCSYANSTFDKYINPDIPNAPMRRGMAPLRKKEEQPARGRK